MPTATARRSLSLDEVGPVPYFIGHDLGTGGNKAVLVDASGHLLATAFAAYDLRQPQAGWAEQDPEDWWQAVATCTRAVVRESGVDAADVAAISFSGQMLCLVPMRADGSPTRPAISWLDHRGDEEARHLIRRLGGAKIVTALAGVLPTGKDLVAKIAWLQRHEPEVFAATHAFGDATSYLVARSCGVLVLDHTGAAATGLLDPRRRTWSKWLARLCRVPLAKLPALRRCAEPLAPLAAEAAQQLGLTPSTWVTSGMADIPSAAVGAGALEDGSAHIYLGTSSWLGVSVARPLQLPRYGIASVAGPAPGLCLLIAESETAAACLDWLKRILGVDHDELERLARQAPPGAAGLLFHPWLFGERAPVPDVHVRAAFTNLALGHERAHLARAVFEGVGFNLRWTLDAVAAAGLPCATVRAIGGGARSDLWLQVLADISGRRIERVAAPQHAGAIGGALAAAVAVGALPDLHAIRTTIRVETCFVPSPTAGAAYDLLSVQYQRLYPALSRLGRATRDLSAVR